MPELTELWFCNGVKTYRPNRPDRTLPSNVFVPFQLDPRDGFNYGIDRPTPGAIGVISGVSRTTYTGATTIDGSTNPSTPTLIQNYDITSAITVRTGYVIFYNCYFFPDVSAKPLACITSIGQNVLGVVIERCTIRPSVPSYGTDAVRGHHTTLKRCDVSNTVDGFGSYNIYARRTDNYMLGNKVYDLCKFDDDGYNDSPRVSGSHVDGTHNDNCQHQGGEGLWVIGNDMSGYNRYADGSRPSGLGSLMTTQAVLVQQNVAVGGVYYCDDIHINYNWVVEGFNQAFALITRSSGGTPYSPEIIQNRWLTGTTRYYDIRSTMQVSVNGHGGAATSETTYPADNNKYANTTDVDVSKRGQYVIERKDTSF